MCPNESLTKLPDVSFIGGTSRTLRFHIYSESGKPVSLEGARGMFTIVNAAQRNVVSHSKAMTKDRSADNVFTVTLDAADTKDLYGKFIYQVTIISADGKESPTQGNLYIGWNIDRT